MIWFAAPWCGADPVAARALHRVFRLTSRRVDRRQRVGRWGLTALFLAAGVQASTHVDGSAAGDAAALLYLASYFLPLALLDHAAVLSAPDDHRRIGHLPLAASTYYYARIVTSLGALLPVLGIFVAPLAIRAPRQLPGFLVEAAALCLTLLMLANGVQRWFAGGGSRASTQRRLAFLQACTMLLYVGGLSGLRRLLGAEPLLPAWLSAPWQPTWWFASLGGPLRSGAGLGGAAAALLLAALGIALVFRPSSRGFGPSAPQATGPAPTRASAGRGARVATLGVRRLFPKGRGASIATLVLAHLRHDTRVFAQMVALVPASALILVGSLADTRLADPFVFSGQYTSWGLIYAYVLLVYVILCDGIARSSSASAAWIFRVACADPAEPFVAAQRLLRALVFWPYLLALAAFLLLHHGHPAHALMHGLVLALAAELVVGLLRALRPRHPFSEQLGRGAQPVRLLTRNLLVATIGTPLLLAIHRFGLRPAWVYLLTIALTTLLAAALTRIAATRARRVLGRV